MFDDASALIRIDMSEYMERHSVSRLIGAPPGYVGYEEGGKLTEAVRRRPYSVVLMDEIEKAHVDVFNILLQVLDDGRLTDNHGRTVDFTNTIVVMTSNMGSQQIQQVSESGGDQDELKKVAMEALKGRLLPEFINRIDEVMVFEPLSRAEIRQIVDIQIEKLERMLGDQNIAIVVTEDNSKSNCCDLLMLPSSFDLLNGQTTFWLLIQSRPVTAGVFAISSGPRAIYSGFEAKRGS